MTGFQSFYAQRLSVFVEHLLSLLVVFLMMVAAALWTGKLFGHDFTSTKNSDEHSAHTSAIDQPNADQLQAMGIPEKDMLITPRDSASWQVTSADGHDLGFVVSTSAYASGVKGFAGPTPLYIYLDAQGNIAGMAAAANSDTPDFFQHAFNELHKQWNGLNAERAASKKVDAVSGATYSSKAIVANVQLSMKALANRQQTSVTAPGIGWPRTVAVALVLLTGIAMSWKFRGRKRWRLLQQVLNIVVLGFWCGQFLSLSLLRGWISNGLDPLAYLPTLLVLAVTIGMPFFHRKHHYCSWVCPFGSLQALAGALPLPKIHCSAKVYRMMSRIRMGVFCLLMLLLWTGLGGKVLNYEPFTAFMVTSAPTAVLILAGVFVVASCFVPQWWCRCFCPMGMTLDLSEDTSHTYSK